MKFKNNKQKILNKFVGRRTRAAAAKSAIMTLEIASDSIKTEAVDQQFASPKRKDCKLDTDLMPSAATNERPTKSSPIHTATITNGKRNNKSAGGSKTKKAPHAITKYFHANGHNESNGSLNGSISEIKIEIDSSVKNDETATLPNGDIDESRNGGVDEEKIATVPLPNGNVLMSPEAKAIQNGVKQTTPHRIVIRSSPTKKQRLYVKDPVEVFSHLNIRDGASKAGRKGQQKTRRKLNVTETELKNGTSLVTKALEDDVQKVSNGIESTATNAVGNKTGSKPSITARENTSNIIKEESFLVPNNTAPRRVHSTQLTDFFPIRRSGRKTKKAVEQEISRHIEMAIEKQLEDGLIVKMFPEKGRGIVAARSFQRGEFVVEYIGELIDQTEADCREEDYSQKADFGCYMYYFKHKEQQWW